MVVTVTGGTNDQIAIDSQGTGDVSVTSSDELHLDSVDTAKIDSAADVDIDGGTGISIGDNNAALNG